MNTAFLLLAEHDTATLPVDVVCQRYFAPLTLPVFLKKIGSGEIDLVVTRMGDSQKAGRLVHIQDLATYIDRQRAAAARELKGLRS